MSSASQSAEMQRDAIARAAAQRGDTIGEWYADVQSGRSMALPRPELARLKEDAREGKISRVYVFRLDRLTRSGIRDTFELLGDLRGWGVEIVTLADGFDLAGRAADVVIAVMAWAAEMEREAISERIKGARARAKARGESWGRPKRLGKVDVARIRELAGDGKTQREIASALKVPKATVWRALQKGYLRADLAKARPK